VIFENQSLESMIEREEKINEGQIIPRIRVRSSPLNLHRERYQMHTLPQGVIPIVFGDGIMDLEKHLDQFLIICDIYFTEHDDVMVRRFLQTLVGPTYDWYLSLLVQKT
jgi:hypothetical protein